MIRQFARVVVKPFHIYSNETHHCVSELGLGRLGSSNLIAMLENIINTVAEENQMFAILINLEQTSTRERAPSSLA